MKLKICTVFVTCMLFTLLAQSQIPKVVCGSIERLADFQSKYVDARNVDVWLPPGYDAHKKYPVLYMHDGQMLFDSTITWNKQAWGVDGVLCKLLTQNKIKACIVVGIWNISNQRHEVYFQQKAFYGLPPADQERMLAVGKANNAPVFHRAPISDNYLQFLVKELKPYIDTHFGTLTDAGHTFIAGSSMGGLISLYAICEYPNVFGGAACLSTHWTGIFTNKDNPLPQALLNYLKVSLPSPNNHRIYFDHGTKTLDSLYKPYQLQANSIMKAKGYTHKNFVTLEFPGADHTERSWRARLDTPLLFLFNK